MKKRILGVSAGFHDAGLTVIHGDKILFAGHSERYSKKKHDKPAIKEGISYQDFITRAKDINV